MTDNKQWNAPPEMGIDPQKKYFAVLSTDMGKMKFELFTEETPITVNNFVFLAREGFYNGTTFHRVVPGFVIQGGDPNTKSDDRSKHGLGGPGYTLKAEFGNLPHKRGTVSMARAANPDSAGSQFFICVADAAFLDGKYTVFGEVVSGMDVVDQIVKQQRDNSDNPLERIEMQVEIVIP